MKKKLILSFFFTRNKGVYNSHSIKERKMKKVIRTYNRPTITERVCLY